MNDQSSGNTGNTKIVLSILGGAVIIAAALFLGLRDTGSPTPPPSTAVPMQSVPDLTRTVNQLIALVEDARTTYSALEEAFTRASWQQDVAEHASSIEELAQEIRQTAVDLRSSDFEILRRDVTELQHSAHEIEDAAKGGHHDEAHHSAENMARHLDQLQRDVEALAR